MVNLDSLNLHVIKLLHHGISLQFSSLEKSIKELNCVLSEKKELLKKLTEILQKKQCEEFLSPPVPVSDEKPLHCVPGPRMSLEEKKPEVFVPKKLGIQMSRRIYAGGRYSSNEELIKSMVAICKKEQRHFSVRDMLEWLSKAGIELEYQKIANVLRHYSTTVKVFSRAERGRFVLDRKHVS